MILKASRQYPETMHRLNWFPGFCAWITGVARLTSKMFSHTYSSTREWTIFDSFNADVPFCSFETEAKLNKARHSFLNGMSWNPPVDFQPILLEDVRKRTENFRPYKQFHSIEKKAKNHLWGWYDLGVKNPPRIDRCRLGRNVTTLVLYDNLKYIDNSGAEIVREAKIY